MASKQNEANIMPPTRASDATAVVPPGASLSFDRRIPVWGIITAFSTMLVISAGFCISFYISNIRMSDSVDRLTAAVDKQRDNDLARNLVQVQHAALIAENTKEITKIYRDVETLKANQRWAPK